jgi:hypothetical protein
MALRASRLCSTWLRLRSRPRLYFDQHRVSFHHWADQAAGLGEVSRVLRQRGRMVLVDHFATGWLRVFNAVARRNMRTRGDVERLLAGARMTLLAWTRIFDPGRLPLIQAVISLWPQHPAELAPGSSLERAKDSERSCTQKSRGASRHRGPSLSFERTCSVAAVCQSCASDA